MTRVLSGLVGFATVAASVGVAKAQTVSRTDVEDSYEQQAVAVRRVFPIRRDGATSSDDHQASPEALWDAFQGRDHHAISDEQFFRIVGREDLVTRYQHRMVLKRGLTYAAWPLIVGGLTFATLEYMYRNESNQTLYQGGTRSPSGSSPWWGIGIATAGAVSFVVSRFIDPVLIDADGADSLARDYDRSLRLRLGMSDSAMHN